MLKLKYLALYVFHVEDLACVWQNRSNCRIIWGTAELSEKLKMYELWVIVDGIPGRGSQPLASSVPL